MILNMEYNDKLRLFFKNKGLSQKEVGKRLGHAPAMISRFWSGESSFGPEFVVALVREFPDIDLQYIFSEEETIYSVQEGKPFYGLNKDNVDKEMEIIEEKVANVRKYLAQISHKN
jgi:transcriptional regulator with XRE-family HTH domain